MKRNCDIYHVVESLEKCREIERGELIVWDTECIMKGITDEKMDERNIPRVIDDIVCYIEWDTTPVATFKFHQNEVTEPFSIDIAPVDSYLVGNNVSEPKDLGERLQIVQKQLDYAYDCEWDLGKLEAASIAHGGHFTDYEFEYEFSMMG